MMHTRTTVAALCLLLFSISQAKEIFKDDFDTLDFNLWQHEITAGGGGNWEFEYYTNNRSNSYTRNSILYLKPTLTADTIGAANLASGFTLSLWGGQPGDLCTSNAFYGCERTAGAGGNILNPIQSARIRTVNSFSFNGGTVEIRAKLPKGDWIWPAMWMLPKHNAYGSWPASGEIDIMESRGNAPGYPAGGVDTFASTLHWGPYVTANRWPLTHQDYKLPAGKDFSQDFHIFGLSWTNTSISTYVDSPNNVVLKVPITEDFFSKGKFPAGTANPWVGRGKAAPFDQEFFLVFNVAVGGVGGYFPDGQGNKPWSDKSSSTVNAFWAAKNSWYPTWKGEDAALQIDWVKVSQ